MRWIIAAALAALVAGQAADRPKPNTLTPKEKRQGWILLFDGATTRGWLPTAGSDVKWKVQDGVLELTGTKGGLRTTKEFGDFDLSFEYQTGALPAWDAFGIVEATVANDPQQPGMGSGYIGPAPPANTWTQATVHKTGRGAMYRWGTGVYTMGGRALRSAIFLTCRGVRYRNVKLRSLNKAE